MTNGLQIVCAAAAAVLCAGAAEAAMFEPLIKFSAVSGDVRVTKPGAAESVLAVEQYAYPYGSRVSVPKWDGKPKSPVPMAVVYLSEKDHWLEVSAGTDITISDSPTNPDETKVIDVHFGKIKTVVTLSTVKTGSDEGNKVVEKGINSLLVRLPNGVVLTRLTERNAISVDKDGENTTMKIIPDNALLSVTGPQFKIPSQQIRRHSEIEIYGQKDYTRITNLSGLFTVSLDKGADAPEEVGLKQNTVVKIWRSYAEIGGKMAVAVMIVAPNGALKSYAFLEGQRSTTGPMQITEPRDETDGASALSDIDPFSADATDFSSDDGAAAPVANDDWNFSW